VNEAKGKRGAFSLGHDLFSAEGLAVVVVVVVAAVASKRYLYFLGQLFLCSFFQQICLSS